MKGLTSLCLFLAYFGAKLNSSANDALWLGRNLGVEADFKISSRIGLAGVRCEGEAVLHLCITGKVIVEVVISKRIFPKSRVVL